MARRASVSDSSPAKAPHAAHRAWPSDFRSAVRTRAQLSGDAGSAGCWRAPRNSASGIPWLRGDLFHDRHSSRNHSVSGIGPSSSTAVAHARVDRGHWVASFHSPTPYRPWVAKRSVRSAPRHGALRIPEVETLDVELECPLGLVRGRSLHHELGLPDHLVAAVARLASTGAAPDSGDTVLRQASIGEFLADQGPKGCRFHERMVRPHRRLR